MGSKHGIKTKKMLNIGKPKKIDEDIEMIENQDPRMDERFLLTHTLRPPYSVILDTNFINDCIRKKYDAEEQLMKVLNGSVKMYIPECVIGELEKLGRVFRVALAFIKRDNVQRLECDHKGTYADDCIFNRALSHRCYIVATSDTALRQRIKTIPGIPLVTYRGQKCFVERFIPATF